jgi:hypothetical protein
VFLSVIMPTLVQVAHMAFGLRTHVHLPILAVC